MFACPAYWLYDPLLPMKPKVFKATMSCLGPLSACARLWRPPSDTAGWQADGHMVLSALRA